MFTTQILHEISLVCGSTLVSHHRGSDEELEIQIRTGGARLSMVQRMAWGVIRLITVVILAPVTGRGLEQAG